VKLAVICVDDSYALAMKFEFKRLDSVAALGVVTFDVYSYHLARMKAVFIDLHVGSANRWLESEYTSHGASHGAIHGKSKRILV
jgi:hypothetical protein